MKSFILIFIAIATFILSSCEKSNTGIKLDSILATKWALSKTIDNQTGETTDFPDQIDTFYLVFGQYGILELPDYCNYSFGHYELLPNDSLIISNVGPGTEKYCQPDLRMNWENLFINSLRESGTYSITNDQLTINCHSDYNLVFNLVENFKTDNGKLLFCTNSGLINCPFAIEISLNNTITDTLTAASSYSDTMCQCDDQSSIGSVREIASGSYTYYAREINCSAENRVNEWMGEIKIKRDSCSLIFLDVSE